MGGGRGDPPRHFRFPTTLTNFLRRRDSLSPGFTTAPSLNVTLNFPVCPNPPSKFPACRDQGPQSSNNTASIPSGFTSLHAIVPRDHTRVSVSLLHSQLP
jgi:hypothetical protein